MANDVSYGCCQWLTKEEQNQVGKMMKKPNMPDTDLIESEYSETDCDSFGDSYVCNDCSSHDVGLNGNQEAFCYSCASLNVIIE